MRTNEDKILKELEEKERQILCKSFISEMINRMRAEGLQIEGGKEDE